MCFGFGTWDEMSAKGAGVKKQLSFVGLASDNGDTLADDGDALTDNGDALTDNGDALVDDGDALNFYGDGFWVAGKKLR